MGQEFVVAARRAEVEQAKADGEDVEFMPVTVTIRTEANNPDDPDDVRDLTMHWPGDGPITAFMATNASFSSPQERVAGAINFFVSMLEPEDHSYVVSRLFDRKDSFGSDQITAFIEHAMGEWAGRPTKPPSGSGSSRRTAGRKSTRSTPALT